jgi:hypothetical protein
VKWQSPITRTGNRDDTGQRMVFGGVGQSGDCTHGGTDEYELTSASTRPFNDCRHVTTLEFAQGTRPPGVPVSSRIVSDYLITAVVKPFGQCHHFWVIFAPSEPMADHNGGDRWNLRRPAPGGEGDSVRSPQGRTVSTVARSRFLRDRELPSGRRLPSTHTLWVPPLSEGQTQRGLKRRTVIRRHANLTRAEAPLHRPSLTS